MEVNIPSNEADDAGSKQETTEPSKEPFEDLAEHIVLGWGNLVLAVGLHPAVRLRSIKPRLGRDIQSLKGIFDADLVPVERGEFCKCAGGSQRLGLSWR